MVETNKLNPHLPVSFPGEEHLLRLLLDGVEDYAIYAIDLQGNVVTWNTGATRLKGYTGVEVIGAPSTRFFTVEDRRAGKPQALLELAAAAGHAEDEGWRQRKDGSLFWCHESYTPLYSQTGSLIGFAKVTRDRSRHRQYEERIRQLNRIYSVLSEVNQLIVRERNQSVLLNKVCQVAVERGGFNLAWISLLDPQTNRPSIAGSWGLDFEDVQRLEEVMQQGRDLARSFTSAADKGDRYVVEDVFNDPHAEVWRASARRLGYCATATFALRVRGEVRGAFSLCAPLSSSFNTEQVRMLDELALDIGFAIEVAETEQRRLQAMQELSNSETRYRSLVEHAPNAIFVDVAGHIVLVNDACLRLFGATNAEQLLGKTPYDLFIPESHDAIRQGIASVNDGNESATSVEDKIVRLDGTRVDVEVSAASFPYGSATAVHVILQDISERKRRRADLLRLNAELEQRVVERTDELQMRNRELETFTYSVSHDLKAPLRGIDGYSRLLQEDYSDRLDAEGRRFLDTIRRATEQMNQLIEDLLAYSRLERRTLQAVAVNLSDLVHALLAEQRDEIRLRPMEVHVDLPEANLHVDPEGMRLALRNLLDNAFKFTRTVAAPVINVGGSVSGTLYTLWVQDNGIGFDMKYQERVFEIFQRLHRAEEYGGTGVGLAIVRKAIERMGGRSWVTSAPGTGATFYLEIPLFPGHKTAHEHNTTA